MDFPTLRTVNTSSWLARALQGLGLGTELRGALLTFAFEELGAEAAESSAFHLNPASVRVSEKLGYARNGIRLENVRGQAVEAALFRLTREEWERRRAVRARVSGVEPCLELFGAEPAARVASAERREPDDGSLHLVGRTSGRAGV